MALNIPMPNFNVQQPDILGEQVRQAQLKNMLSETALRQSLAPLQVQEAQQRVQSGDIENQMKTLQLQGQRALSDWLQNGDANQEVPAEKFSSNDKIATYVGVSPNDPIMSVIRSMAQHHVPAPMLMAEAKGMLERRNEYFKGTKEEQDAQKAERLVWQQSLAELHELPEDQRSAQLAAKLPLLQENSKTSPLLDAYVKGLAGHPELIDQAYNTLSAENAALGLRKATAEAKKAEQEVIPEGGGMSPAKKQDIAANVEEAKEKQPLEIEKAKAEALVHAQVQAQMLPLVEQIRQQFGNQKDARDKIETGVLKPFQDKMTDITMARSAIAQAADNPVAARAAVFKMVGVAQPTGSHRVLPMEFEAFKYPGGIGTQTVERFNNFLKGEPWTPEVAQAANAFINGQEQAAHTNLNSGIGNVNKLYGTSVGTGLQQPISGAPAVGAIEDGYKFKGGDPSKASSWEKVK